MLALQLLLLCASSHSAAASGEFVLQGCYRNQESDRRNDFLPEGRVLVVECNDRAVAAGKPFFGLEAPIPGSTFCFLLDGIPSMVKGADSECMGQVEGGVLMGDNFRMAVYSAMAPTTTVTGNAATSTTATPTSTTTSSSTPTTTSTTTSTTSSTTSSFTTSTTSSATISTTSSRTTSTTSSTTSPTTTTATTSTTSTTTTSATSTATTTSSSSSTGSSFTTSSSTTSSSSSSTSSFTTSSSTTSSSSTSSSSFTTSSSTTTSTSTSATTATNTSTSTTMTTSTTTTSTTTTSTTTTSTTVTTTVTATPPPPAMLLQLAEPHESALVVEMLRSNQTASSTRMGDFVIVAARLDASQKDLTLRVDGTEIEVTFPASILDSAVLLVTSFSPTSTASMSSNEEGEVQSAVNVNLVSLSGARLKVSDLSEPVKITLPTNSSEAQCVYWDVVADAWAFDGLERSANDGAIVCYTTHFTLFAAIVRGFANTFACSQLALLNAEAIHELGTSNWHRSPAAIALWVLLLVFALLLALASTLDWRRWRECHWTDEVLLIARLNVRPEQEEEPEPPVGCVASVLGWAKWCLDSSALREALDDVMSTWFDHFAEARDLVEGLMGGLELGACRVTVLLHRILKHLLARSARRQASASLGISDDAALFLLEDEKAVDLLRAHGGHLGELHEAVGPLMERHLLNAHSWLMLPRAVWRLFLWHTPLGQCMVQCLFMTSTTRVVLFMVDVTGALLMGTVFFEASGIVSGKARLSQDCDSNNLAERVGRLLAIGVGSFVIASFIGILLGSLSTRVCLVMLSLAKKAKREVLVREAQQELPAQRVLVGIV